MKKILEKLSDYRFHLRFLKGKDMVISDYFSRYPTVEVEDDDPIAFPIKTLEMETQTTFANTLNVHIM